MTEENMTTVDALEMVLELAKDSATSAIETKACYIVENLVMNEWMRECFHEFDSSEMDM